MNDGTATVALRIGGMTCSSCRNRIQTALGQEKGVVSAEVDCGNGSALIRYRSDEIQPERMKSVIEDLGYTALPARKRSLERLAPVGIIGAIVIMFLLLRSSGLADVFTVFPTAGAEAGFAMLFAVGFLTSFHCMAMCGGIGLSQCVSAVGDEVQSRWSTLRPALLYNLGRVVSYTVIGGVVGAIGSVISPTGEFRGIVQLIAGLAMVIMGATMLGAFPFLKKITPRLPRVVSERFGVGKLKSGSPFLVGLLNGLMPCGPLQAMQVYALSTGSAAMGALSMLCFSLGTVPLMLGLGALFSAIGKKFARKAVMVGAALILMFGVAMVTQGMNLSGFGLFAGIDAAGRTDAIMEGGTQVVRSTLESGAYPTITVERGSPVAWTIEAPQGSINGCNESIVIPEYGIEWQFGYGDNVIEFMPDEAGVFTYSCWMGMISGEINVIEPQEGTTV